MAVAVALIAPFFWVVTTGSSAYASNGNPKNYSVTVTPTVGAGESGAGNQLLTVTITNQNPLQDLGSVNMSLPGLDFVLPNAGPTNIPVDYQSTPTPDVTVTVAGGVVEVRGMSLPNGDSVTFTVTAYAPCVSESGSWSVQARQANDFSGSGNGFSLLSTPTVTVTGACSLQFIASQEPADAQVNTPISTVPFSPPANSSQDVEAQLVDDAGNPVNPADQAASTTTAVANLDSATGPALEQVTTSAGIASFPSLEVGAADAFTSSGTQSSDVLIGTGQANSSVNGIPSSPLNASNPSAPFHIWGAGTLCNSGNNPTKCMTFTGANVNSSISGTPNPNVGVTTLEVTQNQESIDCKDSFSHAPAFSTFASTASAMDPFQRGILQVTITISNPVVPASQYEVCFQDPNYRFFLLGNGSAPQLGALGQPGLLATCKQTGGAIPCVGSISKNKQGAVVEMLNIPPGDPCVH
jgi:hypothetical protein